MNSNFSLRNNPAKVIFASITFIVAGVLPLCGSTMPVHLQCEFRSNPQGIDVARPRLMWQMRSDERDQRQTAYQVLVASSEKLLNSDQGDLWNSGRVASDDAGIIYSGKPLKSGGQCFWNVKLWDKNGRATKASAPARWSMGLLEPSDWQGKWIGLDQGEKTNDFGGAQWVWFPEGNPAESAPLGTRYFRRIFELPASNVSAATIEITADDQFRLFVNGSEAGNGDSWKSPKAIAVGSLLKQGKNILAVEARNVGNTPNPAGLICKLKIAFEGGNVSTLVTDGSWKSATNADGEWNTLAFDDTAWTMAKALGEYGMQVWGIIQNDDRQLPARYLRREFTVEKKVRRATAYICGLGLCELYLNGQKVSDDVLSPAIAEYDKRAFYVTYDVTDQIRLGDNVVGVMLGNGRFFSPRLGVPATCRTFGYPKLLLQLNVEYTDGTTSQVVSDENWKLTTNGPIRANNEFDGEEYDARMEMPGWSQTKFDDSKWRQVQLVKPGAPVLSAQIGEPIRVLETISPLRLPIQSPESTFMTWAKTWRAGVG